MLRAQLRPQPHPLKRDLQSGENGRKWGNPAEAAVPASMDVAQSVVAGPTVVDASVCPTATAAATSTSIPTPTPTPTPTPHANATITTTAPPLLAQLTKLDTDGGEPDHGEGIELISMEEPALAPMLVHRGASVTSSGIERSTIIAGFGA